MKRLLLLIPLMLILAACAVKGPLAEDRQGNVVTFARPDTGNTVTVTLSPELTYDKRVHRKFMGATIEGWLYRAEDGTSVLVSSMDRAKFEDLIGRTIDAPRTGVRVYPPQTSWLPRLCQLVRAYVVSLDSDVVSAVKFGPRPEGECDGLVDNDEYMVAHLNEVAEFDRRAEQEIRIDR
ncbi:hypothetical protein [uncultured Pseudodesulfovibrio sp.]|uniref:hypothetical protein n=1 Tax=uncultured Pseudodesulfovibrio sp. TaxID=2035858 RepID=UPI0029C8027D|nr:hypothetical protein [uncultured Pseudodesulfovibrio sp.]